MSKKIVVKTPATSANLGSGFDCLAIALDIFNTVSVEIGNKSIRVVGEGENELPVDENNLIYKMIKLIMDQQGYNVPELNITCDNNIPMYNSIGFKKTINRKIKELITAIKIEQTYTKSEILELYLNHIFAISPV